MIVPVRVNSPAKLSREKLFSNSSWKIANICKQSAGVLKGIWRSFWTYCPCSAYRTIIDHARQSVRHPAMHLLPIECTALCLIPDTYALEKSPALCPPPSDPSFTRLRKPSWASYGGVGETGLQPPGHRWT